ncbi:MAG: SCO family protein [Anaerolineae bacterium]|nr:SCO family protein [Anaerolineae bacterium]
MKPQSIILSLGAAILLVVGAFLWVEFANGEYEFNGSTFEPFPDAYPFELVDADGELIRLEDMRGKVALVFFGYTNCPDVCPTTLIDFKRMIDDLGIEATGVEFVFIAVDPARDTPERMAEYAHAFDENIIALSGTEEELRLVWDGYYFDPDYEEPDESGNYLVSHSGRVFVVDKSGRLRLTFPAGMAVGGMLADIRFLIAE